MLCADLDCGSVGRFKMFSILQGESFTMLGPFLVAEIRYKEFNLKVHAKEDVPLGGRTTKQIKKSVSWYRTTGGLCIVDGEGIVYDLPSTALVLVLPGTPHSWICIKGPRRKAGAVESIESGA